jgi:hypothetical protein
MNAEELTCDLSSPPLPLSPYCNSQSLCGIVRFLFTVCFKYVDQYCEIMLLESDTVSWVKFVGYCTDKIVLRKHIVIIYRKSLLVLSFLTVSECTFFDFCY